MTRAKLIEFRGVKYWFDTSQNNRKATAQQLELLAVVEHVDLEELLEGHITQAEVLDRLRAALGNVIPHADLLARQKWRRQRQTAPPCRLCGKKGDSTRHHFVNRWILKELADYRSKWSNRRDNCIPVCIDCHRDLHERSGPAKSIAHLLSDREKEFAERALQQLADERPKLLILLARGDDSVYEARLVKDWFDGRFIAQAENAVRRAA